MDSQTNKRPANYLGSRSAFESKAVEQLLGPILKDCNVLIDNDRDKNESVPPQSFDFILAPPRFHETLRLITFPDYWVGVSYSYGRWYLKEGDLSDFIGRLLISPPAIYLRYFSFISKIRGPFFRFKRAFLDKNETRSVSTHYDLDSEMYASFLDEEMIYTCAFFDDPEDALEDAQQRKLDIAIERIGLRDTSVDVLDIGSGWGALERRIVKVKKNWKITGLSLSINQINWAQKRNEEKLTDIQLKRINYECKDYLSYNSDKGGEFDGIFVIGMLEHVGKENHRSFVKKITELLRSNGRCLIHTIVGPESRQPSNKWIDANIFPGGYAPSVAELVEMFEGSGLIVDDIFLHAGVNYRLTIERWTRNFVDNWVQAPETHERNLFFRTWYFYLSSVRNMFDERILKHQIAQIVLRKL